MFDQTGNGGQDHPHDPNQHNTDKQFVALHGVARRLNPVPYPGGAHLARRGWPLDARQEPVMGGPRFGTATSTRQS